MSPGKRSPARGLHNLGGAVEIAGTYKPISTLTHSSSQAVLRFVARRGHGQPVGGGVERMLGVFLAGGA